jgi:hypothetical protein
MSGFVVFALSTFVSGVNSVQVGEVHSEAPLVRRDEPATPHNDEWVQRIDFFLLMDPILIAGILVCSAAMLLDKALRKSKDTSSVAIDPPVLYQNVRKDKKKQRLDQPRTDLQATQGSRAAGFLPLSSLRSVRDILSDVDNQIDRMNLQRIGAVCNRIGKVARKSDFEYGASPILVRLLTRLESLIDAETDVDVRCPAVAAAIWALAKIGYSGAAETREGTGPLSSLKVQFIDNIQHFRVEETTNTIWSLSELRRRCDISVLDVAVAVCANKDAWAGYSDEELIFLAWASARVLPLNHVRADARVSSGIEHLLKLTSKRFGSPEKVASVCPKFTVMLTWALTQFGLCDGTKSLLAAFAESASTTLESFTISEVTALLWALTKNGKFDSPLYETYKARCVALQFEGLNSQDIANAVCIFARREVCDDEFLKKLNDATEARKVRFNQTEERMMGWARKQRPRVFGHSAAKADDGAQ